MTSSSPWPSRASALFRGDITANNNKAVAVFGIKEIDNKLKKLVPNLQRKVIRQSMRAGLKLLAAAVKAEAPVDTGHTRANVKVRAVKKKKRGSIELEVRIEANDQTKRTSAKTGKTAFYPAIVERVHNAFMARAFDSRGEAARQRTLVELQKGVEREASK